MTNGTPRGHLRIYLGAAPGVGKTFAMLSEGRRRAERGTDVVIGLVEAYGRAPVMELTERLETVPAKACDPDSEAAPQVDVDAVIARGPQVVLIDDLAQTNSEDSANAKRWQDVDAILRAGIDVITTVNIEHLESLADVVESITGEKPHGTVPDDVVRRAEQIELVDMTPEALRRRMAHGNVYPAHRIDAALSRYFRVGNLAALRELALLWLADRVDEGLERYRSDHDINSTWAARERVVVALTGGPESEMLLRRGARIASRGAGGELHAVFVSSPSGRTPAPPHLARLRVLTDELGGRHHTLVGDDVAEAVLQFARGLNVNQIVVGASRKRRWRRLFISGVSDRIIAESGDIDVLVVTHPYAGKGATAAAPYGPLGFRRLVLGWGLAILGPVGLSAALIPLRDVPTLTLAAMCYLALTVVCALVGGLWPALTAAVTGSILLNWYFTPPHHTLTIADSVNIVALILFVLVATSVASVVDKAARRSIQANRAQHEADTLSMLNRTLLKGDQDVRDLLKLVSDTFGVEVAALARLQGGDGWQILAAVGERAPSGPDDASDVAEVSSSLVLALRGQALPPHERTVLSAFATHLAVVLDRQDMARHAQAAEELEAGNRVRTALLAAVSHDLRTPLAGIKAAVSSLRSPDVQWTPADQAELLAAIEESADRLHSIVANLLDLSRLQTGTVQLSTHQIGLDDVVSQTVANMPQAGAVEVKHPERLPPVQADAGLLDRIVDNLVANALHHSPPDCPVTVSTSCVGDRVQLHVVDHGPGVADSQKDQMFEPFQRLGDEHSGGGVGLGLAVAKGLTEALGGGLIAENTPGGGLTMVVDLPAAALDDNHESLVAERQ